MKQGFGKIEKFMVAGASKRGWTTWTTAAVDKRVIAAIPIVMDMANFNAVFFIYLINISNLIIALFASLNYKESAQSLQIVG